MQVLFVSSSQICIYLAQYHKELHVHGLCDMRMCVSSRNCSIKKATLAGDLGAVQLWSRGEILWLPNVAITLLVIPSQVQLSPLQMSESQKNVWSSCIVCTRSSESVRPLQYILNTEAYEYTHTHTLTDLSHMYMVDVVFIEEEQVFHL